jgi:hypothetical protein
MDPSKVWDVLDWMTPRTTYQVYSFLGLAGYYHRFILNFFKIAKPITDLLKKEEKLAVMRSTIRHMILSWLLLSLPCEHGGIIFWGM